MDTDSGRVPDGTRLSPSAEPQSSQGLGPSGFDPSREDMRRALQAFPPDAVKVLNALGDGEYVQSAYYVSADIGVPEKRVKEVHRALRTLGFAEFGVLTREDDCAVVGSGYWKSSRGYDLASGIEAATADETALAGSAEGDGPVGEAETPKVQP